MRRKDREMDQEFARLVIDKSRFGVLSINDDEGPSPYSIPLSIIRNEDRLYFHSARDGKKVELFAQNHGVRVVFVGDVHVPELYTVQELDAMVKDPEKTVQLIKSVFTTEYESAIVEGRISEVTDEGEKALALRLICEKYTPDKMAYFEHALKAGAKYTRIYQIQIASMTAKRKKYDRTGIEMKGDNVCSG